MLFADLGAEAQPTEPRRRATASIAAARRPFAIAPFFNHTTRASLATEKT